MHSQVEDDLVEAYKLDLQYNAICAIIRAIRS